MEGEAAAAVLQTLVQNLIDLCKKEISQIRGLDKDAAKLAGSLDMIKNFLEGGGAAAAVEVLVQNLIDLCKKEISQIRHLKKDAAKLTKSLKTIQKFLNDAETRDITSEAVKEWLKNLEDVAFDADNVLDELNYHILSDQIKPKKAKGGFKKEKMLNSDESGAKRCRGVLTPVVGLPKTLARVRMARAPIAGRLIPHRQGHAPKRLTPLGKASPRPLPHIAEAAPWPRPTARRGAASSPNCSPRSSLLAQLLAEEQPPRRTLFTPSPSSALPSPSFSSLPSPSFQFARPASAEELQPRPTARRVQHPHRRSSLPSPSCSPPRRGLPWPSPSQRRGLALPRRGASFPRPSEPSPRAKALARV